ncbi:MAG: HesA/MoeB/ThiF family protein [Candidatus Omnitrophica bacterium]|nr:HesA/MoeB/ThiF family protein [Candidatus Omnitrophota bacterium]MCM8770567.1 HesA/MoeB/ThiF family protein [Candidatus Omnitrophota bacterium]
MDKKLTHLELERYNRQILLEDWGPEGQLKLKNACVFIAGAGGLGSPVSIYLAAAGVGNLRICDFGVLELSNLNRQILHDHSRLDKAKALSAKETLGKINPYIKIEVFHEKIEESSIAKLVGDASVIVDCLDNFPTRYILNEFAVRNKLVFVHGSIWGWEGRVTTMRFPQTACFSCVFPEPPPAGVFPVVGVTPGIIGCLQAAEVIKYLVGIGSPLYNELLLFNAKNMEFERLKVRPDPNCPVCAKYR